MKIHFWVVVGLLALALAGAGAWLHHAPRPVPGNPVPPLEYLQAEPYPGSCAAWLGDELIVTSVEGARPGRIPLGAAVRTIPGAGWVHELPDDQVAIVKTGTFPERSPSSEPDLVTLTAPDPEYTLADPGGRAIWVKSTDSDVVWNMFRFTLNGVDPSRSIAAFPSHPSEVHAVLGDGTFLISPMLFDLRRVRGDGSGDAPLPEHSGHLVAPVSEGGRWVTLQHKDTWSLAELRWGDAPQILQEQPLPGRPVTLRADDDGPVALVAIRPRQLAVWWWRPEGAQITPLPWLSVYACLALRGSKVGVFGFGHTFALDRTTGRTWRP